MPKIAAIQMTSTDNVDTNLAVVSRLLAQAVQKGAQCVVLPENVAFMGKGDKDKLQIAETYGKGKIQSFLSNQAALHKVWLIAGTIPIKSNDPNKVFAACLVYNAAGELVTRYDKIHLFDVIVNKGSEIYRESATIQAGNDIVTLETPLGCLGLAVCYDIRFPELFRAMLSHQVDVFILPSAFTQTTGKVHWQPLLQSRAIENLSYVVASAQWGTHPGGRKTFGHAMIVDPWGSVVECLPEGEGVVCADIDLSHLHAIRADFPALKHRRLR
ncbi:MAG: acyltransferase [Gammaproteobacteria bacterium]|jgi:nitrilase|nr:acyltransferase [Gammaproteobacteria bacterium]